MLKKELLTATLFTLVTTVGFGLLYPLGITALAQLAFPDKANGQLLFREGVVIGSRLLAQPFSGPGYFHPRPSSAGPNGYDPKNSSPSNLGPTNRALVERVAGSVGASADHPGRPVPIDLVTTSGSGLDPHITPAGAFFQAERVARARGLRLREVEDLVRAHTEERQLGVLGEPRVNVLELNLALDAQDPKAVPRKP
jgi:K+-transporting ATPase ATPase C chain